MRRYMCVLTLCGMLSVFSGLLVHNELFPADASVVGNEPKMDFSPVSGAGRGNAEQTGGPRDFRWHDGKVTRRRGQAEAAGSGGRRRPEPAMQLAVVSCGKRLEEAVTMIKSAVLFSLGRLHVHIFTEDHLQASFREELESWPDLVRSRFNYTIYPVSFPSENAEEWKKLFRPCASQRLFLPSILKDVDSIVYVDSDVVFLQPVDDLWSFLSQFNSSQLMGMAPEDEEPHGSWYNRFARHPYYGRLGINSGVLLMNMTRIRSWFFKNDMTSVDLRWEELFMPLLQKYKLNISWGDQDLLNIIFHYNPGSLLELPCQWNFRPDHCMYGSNCASAKENGVCILHGNRAVFHNDEQPAFRAVYEAIKKYTFGTDPLTSLLEPLEEHLLQTTHTYCGKSHALLTKRLAHRVTNIRRKLSRG